MEKNIDKFTNKFVSKTHQFYDGVKEPCQKKNQCTTNKNHCVDNMTHLLSSPSAHFMFAFSKLLSPLCFLDSTKTITHLTKHINIIEYETINKHHCHKYPNIIHKKLTIIPEPLWMECYDSPLFN